MCLFFSFLCLCYFCPNVANKVGNVRTKVFDIVLRRVVLKSVSYAFSLCFIGYAIFLQRAEGLLVYQYRWFQHP